MRNLMNSDQSYTGLVQKYIGSAYDVVYAVYLALAEIKAVSGAIDSPEWDELVKLAPHFEEFMQMLQDFHSSFYGALMEPLTNAAGEYIRPSYDKDAPHMLSQDGDLYYDKTRMGLYIYEDGNWERVGATSNQLEVIKVEPKHIQGGKCRIPLTHGYHPGTNSIMVFVNATFQYPVSNANPDGAYLETDSHHIEFPIIPTTTQGNIEVGDVVTVLVGGVVTNVEHQFSVDVERHQVGNVPQATEFTVSMGYSPGAHNLEVYVDGLRQVLGDDYVETDVDKVTFLHPIMHGSTVIFKKGHVIGNSAGASRLGDFDVLNVAGEFYWRQTALSQNSVIMLLGYYAVGDGGGGLFVYDPGMQRSYANGGTVIDASRPLDEQGKGTGTGAWVRQYDRELNFGWFGVDEPLVSSLTKIPLARDADIIYVEGYHEAGDGGEGWFRYDADRPKYHHDGGTIIDPHQAFPKIWNATQQMDQWFQSQQVPTAGVTGCWIRMNMEDASVNWFGAKGDGQMDNAKVFEGIGRALGYGDIQRLRIPAGTYLIDSLATLRVNPGSKHGGVEICGEGRSSVIQLSPRAADVPFLFNNCSNSKFRNFRIEDLRKTKTGVGLKFAGGSNLTVENAWFMNFDDSALLFEGTTSMHRVTIDNCVFGSEQPNSGYETNPAVRVRPGAASNEFNLRNCSFRHCGTAGGPPLIEAGQAYHDAVISNNFFEYCNATGIKLTSWEEIQVSENHFTDHTGHALEIDTTQGSYTGSLAHCLVRDNVIEKGVADGTYAFRITGDTANNGSITLESNHVTGALLVTVDPSAEIPHISVLRNDVENIPQNRAAVFVDAQHGGSAAGIVIADNSFENVDPARTNALVELQRANDALVATNHFVGGGTVDIQLISAERSRIMSNMFYGSNVADAPDHRCIDIGGVTSDRHTVQGNKVHAGATGHPKTLLNSMQTPTLFVSGNEIGDLEDAIVTPPTVQLAGPDKGVLAQLGFNRIGMGTAPPGPGNYAAGDIVFNTAASASGDAVGWIYDGATWRSFGALI